jgi:hypothetical protein
MPPVPICMMCHTDEHLVLEKWEPGYHWSATRTSWTGEVLAGPTSWVNPVATYRCGLCELSRAHSVPASWDPWSLTHSRPGLLAAVAPFARPTALAPMREGCTEVVLPR